jgi:hypothetical protein
MQTRRAIAKLSPEELGSLEVITNKIACAKQALSMSIFPSGLSRSTADKFFREIIFALADAKYLEDVFWREIALKYKARYSKKIYIDFSTSELLLEE